MLPCQASEDHSVLHLPAAFLQVFLPLVTSLEPVMGFNPNTCRKTSGVGAAYNRDWINIHPYNPVWYSG